MTVTAAYWFYGQVDPQHPVTKTWTGIAALHLAGMPYHSLGKAMNWLDAFNYGAHNQMVARQHFNVMVDRGMKIPKSSLRHFAQSGVGHRGLAYAIRDPYRLNQVLTKGKYLRFAGKAAGRLVPGLGWALLAYDLYTVGRMITD